MRLMILIIALVLGTFMLLNALTQRKQKKQHVLNEDLEQKILENTESSSNESYTKQLTEQDPLLDVTPITLAQKEEDLEDSQKNHTNDRPKSQEFITLTILPKYSGNFSESVLMAALMKNHFCFGAQKLYHRHIKDNPQLPIMYSVGSLAKPGYFELDSKIKQSFVGIFIYMALDIADPEQTFEKMLTCARQLSASLNAQICDEKRDPLSTLTLKKIREKIKELQDAPQKELEEW